MPNNQQNPTNTLAKGTILKDYEIVGVLGTGGFGITYKAIHTTLNITRAIKEYMPSSYASRGSDSITVISHTANKEDGVYEWGKKRFSQEAKLLSEFNFPSIVKIIDYFEANNTAYFVMEYYDGDTLEKFLQKENSREIPEDEIVSIIMPILEGLKIVHKSGYLHRDIAPDNIFLRDEQMPVLIDFGASRNAVGNKSQNMSAIIKAGYSPVEQYTANSSQNATADIYAISAVMYEMITKKRPPESNFRQLEMYDDKPDPIENIVEKYSTKYSKPFLETIQKGLEVRQKDRIQSIAEFQEKLIEESSKKEEEPTKASLKDLDDLILMAGSDKIITKNEEAMILKKAKSLGLNEEKTKEYIFEAIKFYDWSKEEKEDTISSYNSTLPTGYKLLNYTILKVIGIGGFGIVYKAKDTDLDKLVVIKEYMPNSFASRTDNTTVTCFPKDENTFKWGLKRFLEEARILRKFDHPSIIKTHRFFEANNTAYFVMDYYEGKTLAWYINKNRVFSQDEILEIIIPILDGLKEVHSKGYLHRDIEPNNIFLRVDKLPILIDFGASRNAIRAKSQNISAIVKTGYSPPEQYNSNSNQDVTTDLYAISAVIYEMIVGKKPPESIDRQTSIFNGEKDLILDLILEYQDRYNFSFLKTVQRGLNIKQEDRVQSIEEFQYNLMGKNNNQSDTDFYTYESYKGYLDDLYLHGEITKEEYEERLLSYNLYGDTLPRGFKLKDYTILEVLGIGSIGVTYKAKDNLLDDLVVIKEYFPRDYTNRDDNISIVTVLNEENFNYGLEKFIKEARFLSHFDHSSILKNLRIFEANNTAYTVMPYYKGVTLEDELEKNIDNSFSEKDILNIIEPILDGLEKIHSKGYIHRDIAPDNIFLADNLYASILMGLDSLTKISETNYNTDSIVIKSGYTPPEQYAVNSKLSFATDIYALCAIMYKMITGTKPPESTHRQTEQFFGNPDPIEDIVEKYSAKYSKPFLETIQKGLEVKQKDRPQSIKELRAGLLDIIVSYKKDISNKKSSGLFVGLKNIFGK